MDKKNIVILVLVVVTVASLICTIVLATNTNKDKDDYNDYNIAYVKIGDSWNFVAISNYKIKEGVVELTDAVYRVKMKLSMDNCILMKDDTMYYELTH